jgi:DNA-binding MarR family transcriptional regulator
MMPGSTERHPESDLIRDASRTRAALGELLRALQLRDRDRACCYELSASQCHALQVLYQEGPVTVTRLADHLYLEKSTASRLARSLLTKELIRRRAPRDDGRQVILQLSERGHRLARKIINDQEEEYRDLLSGFSREVRSALPMVLDHLIRTVTERACTPDEMRSRESQP